MRVHLHAASRALFRAFVAALTPLSAETYLESADMPLIDKDANNAVVYEVRTAHVLMSSVHACNAACV
jgi:hypothetical protein